MQNEAEKYLIETIKRILTPSLARPHLINLGAAKSIVVEESLKQAGINFICDRVDIQNCTVSASFVGRCFICPLEKMSGISSGAYDCAFSNFVLEHVVDPTAASEEMARLLKPGGQLIISCSNPRAPEFRLAAATPTSFHQFFRGHDHDPAYHVEYAYASIEKLIRIFELSGLELQEDRRWPSVRYYLDSIPVLRIFGRLYDRLLSGFRWRSAMGHSVLVFKKK